MSTARRAAQTPAARSAASPYLRLIGVLLGGALAATLAALAATVLHLARTVVTPARRVPDTDIVSLDPVAQTVTLTRTPDTTLPGRYGRFTGGSPEYLKLGTVVAETDATVTRKLLTEVDRSTRLPRPAGFSGWYYDQPEQLHLPFERVLIGAPVGPCPAWLFPAEPGSASDAADGLWVIQVHGRGARRTETLRAVPLFRRLGYSSLLVSYRNDGDAPRSRDGVYGLGATEWRDVDAAITFAVRRGARRVVVMGWSMGGAIAVQLALNSVHRDRISALVLDSPVADWPLVLRTQADAMRVPRPITDLALTTLRSERASSAASLGRGIPFADLDAVSRAGELTVPILILHSDDDGFVPSDASHALAAARPDLVTLDAFSTARHTKLWNYDEQRWSTMISEWLTAQGLTEAKA